MQRRSVFVATVIGRGVVAELRIPVVYVDAEGVVKGLLRMDWRTLDMQRR